MIQTAQVSLLQRPVVRQFVKFCIIGFSSMIIDVGISNVLTYRAGLYWILAKTISFTIAVTNGFIWNSIWTFRGMGGGARHTMYMRFIAVNVVGLLLNIGLMKSVFLVALTPHVLFHQGTPPKPIWWLATLLAVVFVSVWNFIANRKWTFNG